MAKENGTGRADHGPDAPLARPACFDRRHVELSPSLHVRPAKCSTNGLWGTLTLARALFTLRDSFLGGNEWRRSTQPTRRSFSRPSIAGSSARSRRGSRSSTTPTNG